MKLFNLAIILMIFSGALQAEEVGYEVELIIFEDTTGTYEHSEIWQDPVESDVTTPGVVSKAGKTDPASRDNKLSLLSSEHFRLAKQAKKLEEHPDYRVLYHQAWKQPGLDKDLAFPVQIDSRRQSDVNTPPSSNNAATPENLQTSYINGSVTLIMSRYLHINIDLAYYKPETNPVLSRTDNGDAVSANNTHYRQFTVAAERRMRSREVHFIDHPMVGIIVLTTPFKITSPAAPDSPRLQYKSL